MPNLSLPLDYAELSRSSAAAGLSLTDTVLEPIIFISRSDAAVLRVSLGAVRYVLGTEVHMYAPTPEHNFVVDGQRVFPLPSDIQREIRTFFNGKSVLELSIADVVFASLSPPKTFGLRFSKDLFINGKELSKQLGNELYIPKKLQADLYEYQKQGMAWLVQTLKSTGGVILADEMGLGKTIQVIATILQISPSIENPILIICPTSLIANWCNEIRKFAPSLSVNVHRGVNRAGVISSLKTADIVLSTYDTIVSDELLFRGIKWECIVCDEAQALKNPDSIRRNVVSSLDSRYRLLMTGTPVEISLIDIWSLLDICCPGALGSLPFFERSFPNTQDAADSLNKLVSPFVLRRTVSDVAKDLPDRIDIELPLELDDPLAVQYEQIRKDAESEFGRAGALVATTKLSVFCAFPKTDLISIDLENPDDTVFDFSHNDIRVTPKLEVTYGLIAESIALNKKILVFSNYNHIGLLLESLCADIEINYWNSVNGSTPQELRQKIIDDFSASQGGAVLVLNPKAAGAGLNITAATVVIHYTPVWNPALEMQASARAHRRGQSQTVTVYQLYYKDTVEQVMIERARFRKDLGDRVIPDISNNADDLTRAISITPVS